MKKTIKREAALSQSNYVFIVIKKYNNGTFDECTDILGIFSNLFEAKLMCRRENLRIDSIDKNGYYEERMEISNYGVSIIKLPLNRVLYSGGNDLRDSIIGLQVAISFDNDPDEFGEWEEDW